jgi:NAD(P)-dependent dehydrogenase (short-subunit alcohol dehydrogenase family)
MVHSTPQKCLAIASEFTLENELALVTGAGSGLGLAIARCMANAGARVILVGRDKAKLRSAAASIGDHSEFIQHDVTKLKQTPKLIETIESKFGAVTILVNNAGIHLKKPAVETTDEEFNKVFSTHVHGAYALSRAIAPGMIRRKHGSILFIASMASLFGIPQVVAYSAAKSAHLGLVRTLATEWSPYGVRVNAIAPGWIETDMSRAALNHDPARREKILKRTPLGRFGEPQDVGTAAVYLCSRASKFVTGVVLPVDGGVSIGF